MRKKILIIAGLDPTGNAGLLLDAHVAKDLKWPYFAVTTALTAQSDSEFLSFLPTSPAQLRDLKKLVLQEKFAAVKIGMLGSESTTKFVVRLVKKIKLKNPDCHVVWDPVFFSSSGGELTPRKACKLAIKWLLPLVTIVTPNVPEILYFLNMKDSKSPDNIKACQKFYKKFGVSVYLKGGHTSEPSKDYFFDGKTCHVLQSKKLKKSRRGTGCIFSTALACALADGKNSLSAVKFAKNYVWEKIASCHSERSEESPR